MVFRSLAAALAILAASQSTAGARDGTAADAAEFAAKRIEMEVLRSRLAAVASPIASATLIEAESLLYDLWIDPAARTDAVRAQLELALTRLKLEIEAAAMARR